jgi:hypothetical protein
MDNKIYSSYAAIDRELEILKVQKQLHYQKVKLSFEKSKDAIIPSKSASFVGGLYQNLFSGTYGTIFKMLIPYVVTWYIKRKRGN